MFASAFLRDRIVSGLFNLLVLSLLVIGLRLKNFLLMGHVGLSDFLDGVLFHKQLQNMVNILKFKNRNFTKTHQSHVLH